VELEAAVGDDPAAEADRLDQLGRTCSGGWVAWRTAWRRARQAYRGFEALDDQPSGGGGRRFYLYERNCQHARPFDRHRPGCRRARRALEHDPDCVEHGALLLREAELGHGRGRLDEAHARGAGRGPSPSARSLRSADLEAEALQTIGRVLIDRGEIDLGPRPPR